MSSSQTSSSNSEGTLPAIDPGQAVLAPMFDVRCPVEFILGTGTITIRECLCLEPQGVIRLDQPAGSDLSVRIHNVSVVAGEVVLTDATCALRVSRVLPPAGVEAE
jgi:flagellar motor switch/type III secretory pathway protein FliN